MFLRMIFKAMTRQMGKRIMIAITICLGASLTSSMLAVMMDVGDKVKQEMSAVGANIQVLPKGASLISTMYKTEYSSNHDLTRPSLKESDLPKIKTIFWGLNLEDFAPSISTKVNLPDGTKVKLVGTWFDKEVHLASGEKVNTGIQGLRNWWDITGSWLTDANNQGVMVGEQVAKTQGIKVGDKLTLGLGGGKSTLQVAGIFHAGGDEDKEIFANTITVQKLANRPDQVDSVEVRAISSPENALSRKAALDPDSLDAQEWETWYCTAYISSIAYQIEEALPNSTAKPVRQVADTEGTILDKTQLIMSLVAMLAMAAAALGVASLVSASVMERAEEIGLLKAIGARNGSIVALVLTETLIVGLIGGALGFGIGVGLAQIVGSSVFGSTITIRPAVLPIMAAAITFMILLGSLPALRTLVSLKPSQVLHGK